MSLQLVPEPEYGGPEGLLQLQYLQEAMLEAFALQDWQTLQHLDRIAGQLVDRVVDANRQDYALALLQALTRLKHLYAHLLRDCHTQAASLAV